MYYQGEGLTQNYKEAFKWYKLAAKQGNTAAQSILGFMYYKGEGITQNYIYAHAWYNIASANGYDLATSTRNKLAVNMTGNQIAKAQELASKCMNSNYKDCD